MNNSYDNTVNIFERRMTRLKLAMLKPDELDDRNIAYQTIGSFVDPGQQMRYYNQITAIRALCPTLTDKLTNKAEVARLKKQLPAGIVSGLASGGIDEQHVTERNGVIAFDIDAQDNPGIYDWEATKRAVSKSPYVAYAGLSVSGLGIWGMIPVADPAKNKQHFDAIAADFAQHTFTFMQGYDMEPTVLHGITIDPAPSNVASKRFVSYDPQPYINHAAQVYRKTAEPVVFQLPRFTTSYGGGSPFSGFGRTSYDGRTSFSGFGRSSFGSRTSFSSIGISSFNDNRQRFDIEAFLNAHNIAYNVRERQGGLQYVVTCPWCSLHSSRSRGESAVFVDAGGRPGYHCFHAHCQDKHWREFRQFYEPDAYRRSSWPAVTFPWL